jgi:DGQHR domain-containing protein
MFSIPVTEGNQGDRRFFTGSVRWGDLDRMLVFPDDLEDLDEDHRMQRGLAKRRLQGLEKYLLDVPGHFISALTLVMLPREYERPAMEANGDDAEWDFKFEEIPLPIPGQHHAGVLYLSGDVMLFPADGQHRSYAARLALKKKAKLAREEVPVVLLAFNTAEEVRQLFSDLNLNAKPVSKTIGYDFETRDPLALIAQQVSHEVTLFAGRTQRRTNSLPASSLDVVTLGTLVQGTRSILAGLARKEFAEEYGIRPEKGTDDSIQKYIDKHKVEGAATAVTAVWTTIIDCFDHYWSDVEDGTQMPGDLRKKYLFPHGLGWLGLASAAGQLIQEYGTDWEYPFCTAVQSLDWHRSAAVWVGRATLEIDGSTEVDSDLRYRVNNTGPGITAVANTVVSAAKG